MRDIFRTPAKSDHFTIVLFSVVSMLVGCNNDSHENLKSSDGTSTSGATQHGNVAATADVELTKQIEIFCGACHAVPSPDSFPKHAWRDEVGRGFGFYYESGRKDLTPPVQAAVVSWFQQRAPEQLAEPVQTEFVTSPLEFKMRTIDVAVESPNPTAVSTLRWAFSEPDTMRIWASDMKRGLVIDCDLKQPETARVFNLGANPAGTCSTDLDQNGKLDLVVADLGSLSSEDHGRGQVLWLPDEGREAGAEPRLILHSIGRVADVQAADFDQDGDQDLVVAEFGWHKTGGIHVLYNDVNTTGERTFRDVRIDPRPGTIHVRVTDMNSDGRPDIVALISQGHEVIDVFLNEESGFRAIRLYAAPDPSYGSSGIDLTDFDRDGDVDVLYSVGDTFDSYLIKPYHGIWLLRNNGKQEFAPEHIAAMPGVMRAISADLDNDGDNDIIGAAFLPLKSLRGVTPTELQALIWLEQTADGRYERHVIRREFPIYVSLLVRDIDGDSDLDIVAGCYNSEKVDSPSLLHVFENTRTAN